MTIVVSNHQRIFYRFEGDKGAYLLLHHGLFGSHQDWYDAGYVDALRSEFRLIVMDARGHGRSDHPLEPERYRLAGLADDVIAIMDELDIRNLHFCGYSLGALVGFELLMRHPERVRIVMLAGESPFVSEAMQAEWRELSERIGREGLGPVREQLVAEGRLVAGARNPELEGEQQAAQALLAGLAAEPPRPDEGRISVDSPVALFTGEDDPALERVRDARRRIHRARFVSFPGRNHAGLFHEREALTAEVIRLLRPTRKGTGSGDDAGERRGAQERVERSGADRRREQRGGRRAEERPLSSAPLTPPPPVEVPAAAGRAPAGAEPAAPAGGAPEAPPADAQATDPQEAAPPATQQAPPAPPQPAGEPIAPVAQPDDAQSGTPADDAPEEIPVRARQEEEQLPEEPEPQDDGEPDAPDTPHRPQLDAAHDTASGAHAADEDAEDLEEVVEGEEDAADDDPEQRGHLD